MITRLRRLAALSSDEWQLLLAAAGWLTWLRPALRLWPFLRVERWASPETGAAREGGEERSVRMVAVAARFLPWQPTCLERSLALQRLLTRRGIETQLCIGVRQEGASLAAHAWLEREGRVVNDSPQATETYARLLAPEAVYGAAMQLAAGR